MTDEECDIVVFRFACWVAHIVRRQDPPASAEFHEIFGVITIFWNAMHCSQYPQDLLSFPTRGSYLMNLREEYGAVRRVQKSAELATLAVSAIRGQRSFRLTDVDKRRTILRISRLEILGVVSQYMKYPLLASWRLSWWGWWESNDKRSVEAFGYGVGVPSILGRRLHVPNTHITPQEIRLLTF